MPVYTFDWRTATDDRQGYIIVRSHADYAATVFARRKVRELKLQEPDQCRFDLAAITLELRREEPDSEQRREPEDVEPVWDA